MTILQRLSVVELRVIKCVSASHRSILEVLMAPGALLCLQKLHVEESKDDLHYFADGTEAERSPTLRIGEVVFSLPNLTEVSGCSRLFLLDMPEKWRFWSKCSEHWECRKTGHVFNPLFCRQVWRRVE